MRNLYERLPYNSEVYYDIEEVPQDARHWDINTYVLTNIADILNALDWHFVAANSKNTPRPPKPLPRPKLKKVEKKPKGYWPGKTIVDRGDKNE